MTLATQNSTQATMMKLISTVMKLPQASTAPCFLASASDPAVTFGDSPMKVVGEIQPSGNGADDRREDIADQRLHDVVESRADDHAHGQIGHVAANRKFPEFLQHRHLLLRGDASCVASRVIGQDEGKSQMR